MKSFIPWIGGKTLLARQIVSLFPNDIEVFGGGGSVLFAKEKHAPLEVYNDANGQLVNLFPPYHKTEKYYDAQFLMYFFRAEITFFVIGCKNNIWRQYG